jgi:hypothetical protein
MTIQTPTPEQLEELLASKNAQSVQASAPDSFDVDREDKAKQS